MFNQIESIYDQTYGAMDKVLDISWSVLPFVVMILLLVSVFEAFKNNRGNYTEFFFRIGIAVLGMVSYKWWSVELATLIIEIAKLFKTNGVSEYYSVIIELFKTHAGKEAQWYEVGLQFRGFLYYGLLWISVALVAIATVVFEMLQFWAQAFLWVLGPLAIVMSLFPNFKGAFVNWLNRFIAVGFWSVIYMVATKIFNALIAETFADLWVDNQSGLDVGGQAFVTMKLVLFSLAFFFTIVRIPAMTGWFTKHSFASISYIIGAGATLGADKIFSMTNAVGGGAAKLGKQAGGALVRKLGKSG